MLRLTDAIAGLGIFDEIHMVGVAQGELPLNELVDNRRRNVRLQRRMAAGKNDLLAKIIKSAEWSTRVFLRYRREPIGCVNAHSLAVLPLCVALAAATGAKLVYDTHELETETSGFKGIRQKLGKFVERLLIGRANHIFVVSDSIGDWYSEEYGLKKPTTVRNIPQFLSSSFDSVPDEMLALPIAEDAIRFIYQGGFIKGRGIERLIEIFAASPDKHLIFMGSGPLTEFVRAASDAHSNIHLLPPVAPGRVLSYTKGADVGICLTDNSCLSHYYSLPNKVFEYLHAGLPVIVNPLYEQETLVTSYKCGWVAAEDNSKVTDLLNSIDGSALQQARMGVEQARSDLSWERERVAVERAYRELYP